MKKVSSLLSTPGRLTPPKTNKLLYQRPRASRPAGGKAVSHRPFFGWWAMGSGGGVTCQVRCICKCPTF